MNPHFIIRPACPACGAPFPRTLFARPYADPTLRAALEAFYAEVGRLDYAALLGADFVVQHCNACDLFFQRDTPDDHLLGQLYEVWISPSKAYERLHAHVSPTRERELRREVELSLALCRETHTPPRVLDYGCGWGEWGRAALALGAECWGTELSATRRTACEQAGLRVVPDADLPDAFFDVINADQVFEHLPSPATTLALLRRKLSPGGVIRIAVPNGRHVERSLAAFDAEIQRPRLGLLNAIAPLEHLNGFTTSSLCRLAARYGLVRLRPSWSILFRHIAWPPGARARLKQLALPLYLRSNHVTQLWFTASAAPAVTIS